MFPRGSHQPRLAVEHLNCRWTELSCKRKMHSISEMQYQENVQHPVQIGLYWLRVKMIFWVYPDKMLLKLNSSGFYVNVSAGKFEITHGSCYVLALVWIALNRLQMRAINQSFNMPHGLIFTAMMLTLEHMWELPGGAGQVTDHRTHLLFPTNCLNQGLWSEPMSLHF